MTTSSAWFRPTVRRRADWRTTNASPFGFAFRGHVPEDDRAEYWLYDALGFPIWIHRDNERSPERPMVFILETADNEFEQRRPRTRTPGLLAHPTARELRAVDVSGPAPAKLPAHAGPLIRQTPGPHRLQIVVGDAPVLDITEILHIRG